MTREEAKNQLTLNEINEYELIDKIYDDFETIYKNINSTRQYTGLKDKDGKKIYEGDVIKVTIKNGNTVTGVVVMKYYMWGIKRNNFFSSFDSFIQGDMFMKSKNPIFEVIGNIYENKELLNEQN